MPLADDVDLERLAAGTVGLTGADIRNLVNEAALWASRHDKEHVEMSDFDYARDKVLMGAEARGSPHRQGEVDDGLSRVGPHPAGLAGARHRPPAQGLDHSPRPRRWASRNCCRRKTASTSAKSELQTRLLFLLGGRAAEKLVFDEFSAGAENDLNKATQLARRMVTHWGMSERLGPVAFRDSEEHPFLGREMAEPRRFSEHTAQVIDEEVIRILRAASDRALELLGANRDKLDLLAHTLEKEETLDEPMVTELLGPGKGLGAGG